MARSSLRERIWGGDIFQHTVGSHLKLLSATSRPLSSSQVPYQTSIQFTLQLSGTELTREEKQAQPFNLDMHFKDFTGNQDGLSSR